LKAVTSQIDYCNSEKKQNAEGKSFTAKQTDRNGGHDFEYLRQLNHTVFKDEILEEFM